MTAPTFYQLAMDSVQEFMVENGFNPRDPQVQRMQRKVNGLIRSAFLLGREGMSLNEPLIPEPTPKEAL
ncbi:hypothetical protein [Rhodococcus sp. UNC363MFTsu5.1]|uniref:hypothetical protein n=1 Tax=Rhodococcus sp. UNC363MFTsu5.1 TaxID=1449069 RepID=UPI0004884F52|nr:hypothetical protein [Rhodococcus sp. UNC363MFTsu5.1]